MAAPDLLTSRITPASVGFEPKTPIQILSLYADQPCATGYNFL